jgi:ribonuclease HI
MISATVITDASYDHATKEAGWAAWVKVDGISRPIKHYSSFLVPVANSTQSEKLAAINGIWMAARHGAMRVLVQSDCTAVIHLIDGTTKKTSPLEEWAQWLADAGVQDVKLYARHVRGHTKTNDARSHVNRWCDKMAKKARRKAT